MALNLYRLSVDKSIPVINSLGYIDVLKEIIHMDPEKVAPKLASLVDRAVEEAERTLKYIFNKL